MEMRCSFHVQPRVRVALHAEFAALLARADVSRAALAHRHPPAASTTGAASGRGATPGRPSASPPGECPWRALRRWSKRWIPAGPDVRPAPISQRLCRRLWTRAPAWRFPARTESRLVPSQLRHLSLKRREINRSTEPQKEATGRTALVASALRPTVAGSSALFADGHGLRPVPDRRFQVPAMIMLSGRGSRGVTARLENGGQFSDMRSSCRSATDRRAWPDR